MSKTAVNELSLNVRMSATLIERLQRVADRESNNIAAVVRRLLSAGLDGETQQQRSESEAGR